MELNNKIAGGVIWTAFNLVVNKGFGFIIKLILGKIIISE